MNTNVHVKSQQANAESKMTNYNALQSAVSLFRFISSSFFFNLLSVQLIKMLSEHCGGVLGVSQTEGSITLGETRQHSSAVIAPALRAKSIRVSKVIFRQSSGKHICENIREGGIFKHIPSI